MYESFFDFTERPFPTTPQLQGYFASEQIENALQTIISCVERGAGPALVIASTGTGKTTLVLKLQEHFSATVPVAILSGTNCRSPRILLQNALFSVGLPYVDMDEGQMRLSLTEFFKSRAEKGSNTLLIMDDADALGTDLLEELLGFSSLTGQNGWCVPMVLIGSFRLEEALGSPRVASLNQRIAARCYVDAWSRSEVESYIQSRMQVASNSNDEVFLPNSISKIYEITAGIPRVVNQLCDHALVMAAEKSQRQVDEFSIEEAWADLQRLPLPANHFTPAPSDDSDDTSSETSVEATTDSIVEFGSLDDEPSGEEYEVTFGATPTHDAPQDDSSQYEAASLEYDAPMQTEAPSTTAEESSVEFATGSVAAAAIGGLAASQLLPSNETDPAPTTENETAEVDNVEASYPEQAEAIELQRAVVSERIEAAPLTPPIAERDPGFLVAPAIPEALPTQEPQGEPAAPSEIVDEGPSETIGFDPAYSGTTSSLLGQQPLDPLESSSPITTPETPENNVYEPLPEVTDADNDTSEYELQSDTSEYELQSTDSVEPPSVESETSETPYETADAELVAPFPTDTDFVEMESEFNESLQDVTEASVTNDYAASPSPLPSSELPPMPPPHSPSEPASDFQVNPFLEEFEEEEVVLERAVGMSAAASRVTQSVETEEGQLLSNVLNIMQQQRDEIHAEPQLALQPVDETLDETLDEPDAAHALSEQLMIDQEQHEEESDGAFDEAEPQTVESQTSINDVLQSQAYESSMITEAIETPEPAELLTTADAAPANTLPPMPPMPSAPVLHESQPELQQDAQPYTVSGRFGDSADEHDAALSADELPTPGLHTINPDPISEFAAIDIPSPEFDAPPMGIPRGQIETEESLMDHSASTNEGGQFDDLFSRLRKDS